MKQKQNQGHREETGGRQGASRLERVELGVWDSRWKWVYTEWINNTVLLYSTGKYIQYPVIKL